MELAIRIVGVFGLLILVGLLNACNNEMKHDRCIDAGGKFMINTTHADRSMCILDN